MTEEGQRRDRRKKEYLQRIETVPSPNSANPPGNDKLLRSEHSCGGGREGRREGEGEGERVGGRKGG